MTYNIWKGSLVRLRPIQPSDWEKFHKDGSDSEIARLNDVIYGPRTEEGTRQWTEAESEKGWDGHHFRLAIENFDGELVGSISTDKCDPRHGTFSYGVSVFREYWKKGYASDAVRIVIRYFFDELRYQKVNANVYSFNEGSIRLHKNLGFTEEGRLRSMVYTNGHYHDMLVFGLLKDEFARTRLNEE
ncbi:RimJ/RimL family protein N-acetyltransferase [Bacillus tianshenii]|uniref:RimJ/RimL family protein N-acetyltransferase n=1 Tax=Sutcliffiella tianshenii TaxID=1463404 RepID=A0ABS2NY96_9BACI|nr:GNAT family N-acetyltransferase [Bacillus tianshenii]MBM7619646.1 RimJ/RimL family protein N-acetyltransferase [Bacillus tianshenii]